MAKTKVEKVYCWTGDHEIDPAQWMSQSGMCRVCHDLIESDVLVAHAEPVTEPRMSAVQDGKKCGVDGCHEIATAYPCEFCRMAICQDHTGSREINSERYVACPLHARRDR